MGFLSFLNLEHYSMAHDHELLYQDYDFNCPKVLEETTRQGAGCIDEQSSCIDMLKLTDSNVVSFVTHKFTEI